MRSRTSPRPSAKPTRVPSSWGPRYTGTWQGLPYIRSVSQIDGQNLSGLGIQLYPQIPVGQTLVDFLNGLTSNDSVSAAVPTIRNASTAGCGSCHLPILLDEINGGTNPAYSPYRIGYPDVPFIATSVIQALGSGVAQFAPWTLTATAFRCDNGMIELQPFDCDSPTLNPLYLLYTDLFRQLPAGPVETGAVPGPPVRERGGFRLDDRDRPAPGQFERHSGRRHQCHGGLRRGRLRPDLGARPGPYHLPHHR